MKRKPIIEALAVALMMSSGCAAVIPNEAFPVKVGETTKYYVPWRTDSKGGPEMVGMDTYDADGKLIHRANAGGNSVMGQVLNGAVAAGVSGAGLGVPAALGAWQTHINERNTNVVGSANTQGQIQGQGQGQGQEQGQLQGQGQKQGQGQSAGASAVNTNDNNNSAAGGNAQGGNGGNGGTGGNGGGGGQGGQGGAGGHGNCGNGNGGGGSGGAGQGNGNGNSC